MKSKGVKKMLALVLALSMSMTLLAGCGNNKDSKAADSQTTDGGAEAAVDSDISIGVLIWSTDDGLGADSKTALDAVAEDLNVSLVYRTGS